MKKYARYKDSGISWIGNVPEHWECCTLRKYLTFVSDKGHPEEQLLSVTREQGVIIRNKESKKENHNFIPEDLSGYKLVRKGQFAINKMKSWQGSYAVSEYTGIVSPAYYICDLHFDYKPFFNLAIRSKAYIPFFTMYSKGIRVDQWDLSPVGLKSIPFFQPPLSEQKAIAEYLDKKTAQINELVSAKQKQIELLKEYKQSFIANAITGKLVKNQQMKDSGISWVGKIPEDWDVHYLFQKAREHFISNKDVHHQNLLSLSYGRIIQKDINKTDGLLPESFDTYQIVEKGNIVLRLTDLQNDHKSLRVGYVTQEGIITSAYECLEVFDKSLYSKFFYYQLHSFDVKKMFYGMGGGLRQNISYNELRKIRIAYPPLFEQKEIVAYIEKKVSSIDSQIASIEKQIANLNEYKQSLISDVVTGKVKVC